MNEQNEDGFSPEFLAAERLAEVDALSRSLRRVLAEMIAALEADPQTPTNEILKKLNEVHAAHLKVLTAEDTFHAKIGTDPDADAVDLDAIRFDLGRRLDRLRQSLLAEGLSGDADARTIDDVAVSLRLLGDAASDRTKR